jgi:hypothetical protein
MKTLILICFSTLCLSLSSFRIVPPVPDLTVSREALKGDLRPFRSAGKTEQQDHSISQSAVDKSISPEEKDFTAKNQPRINAPSSIINDLNHPKSASDHIKQCETNMLLLHTPQETHHLGNTAFHTTTKNQIVRI